MMGHRVAECNGPIPSGFSASVARARRPARIDGIFVELADSGGHTVLGSRSGVRASMSGRLTMAGQVDSFAEVTSKLRRGEASAAELVFRRYTDRLVGLARKRLPSAVAREGRPGGRDPVGLLQLLRPLPGRAVRPAGGLGRVLAAPGPHHRHEVRPQDRRLPRPSAATSAARSTSASSASGPRPPTRPPRRPRRPSSSRSSNGSWPTFPLATGGSWT